MLEVRMSGVHLAVPVFYAHAVGILTIHSSVAAMRAVTTEADAEAVVDGVAYFTAPHALFWVASALFRDLIADGGADLLDPHSGERRGDVEGGVDVTLKASKGVSTGESGRAAIESLSLHL